MKKSTKKTTEKTEQVFSLSVLRKGAVELFGVDTATFDGATVGLEGTYSISEIKDRIANFLKSKI